MFDPHLQARIARSCSAAAFGYAAAANQSYFEAADRMLGLWSRALRPAEPEPRSWYRAPDNTAANYYQGSNATEAFQAMMMAPWTLSPAAWPMAMMMVSSGVPRSVAWPAAEANLAAADAVMTTNTAVNQVFSSYRSDSGHAVAQIVHLPLTGAMAVLAAWLPFANVAIG